MVNKSIKSLSILIYSIIFDIVINTVYFTIRNTKG